MSVEVAGYANPSAVSDVRRSFQGDKEKPFLVEHRPHLSPRVNRLIIVPGHMMYRADIRPSAIFGRNAKDYRFWSLNEFQSPEEVEQIFRDHIKPAVEAAALDPDSFIVFSGAQTRLEGGRWSEGASYFAAARALNWFGNPSVELRAGIERYAIESPDNLYNAIRLFQQLHPHHILPQQVDVWGFGFKKERFDVLAQAVMVPNFHYHGISNPANYAGDHAAHEREAALVKIYRKWPFSSHRLEKIAKKREKRNPFEVDLPDPQPRLLRYGYLQMQGEQHRRIAA